MRLISEQSTRQDVRSFTGVPSWNLVMLNRVLEYTGKENILEIWPHMELFVHGGMDFRPYQAQYRKIIPSPDMHYMETYNASEGFFAIAEEPGRQEMLLMLDYGTYYEFLPTDRLGDPDRRRTARRRADRSELRNDNHQLQRSVALHDRRYRPVRFHFTLHHPASRDVPSTTSTLSAKKS